MDILKTIGITFLFFLPTIILVVFPSVYLLVQHSSPPEITIIETAQGPYGQWHVFYIKDGENRTATLQTMEGAILFKKHLLKIDANN